MSGGMLAVPLLLAGRPQFKPRVASPSPITVSFLPTTVMGKNYLLSCWVKAEATCQTHRRWVIQPLRVRLRPGTSPARVKGQLRQVGWGEHNLLRIGREEPTCAAVATGQDRLETCSSGEACVNINLQGDRSARRTLSVLWLPIHCCWTTV